MTLREPGPIPPAFDFTRFLVSSITFMAHLSEVSVYFDDKRLVRLSKDSGPPREVPMIKGLKNTSPDSMMTVGSVQTIRESDCNVFCVRSSISLLCQPFTSRLKLRDGCTLLDRRNLWLRPDRIR